MARTIKLKESELTRLIKTIANTKVNTPINETYEKRRRKWFIRAIIAIIATIGAISDKRLKKNIRRVGKSPSGIPIYEFEYKNKVRFGGGTYRGVLAEHAPKRAVKTHSNGYKTVDYSKIDVAFEKVNPTKRKTIKLKESDLSNIIKRVISEKEIQDPGSTIFYPDNPFERGMSKDPMAPGNEMMDIDVDIDSDTGSPIMMSPEEQMRIGEKVMGAMDEINALEAEVMSNRTMQAELPFIGELVSLIKTAGQELSSGKLSVPTYDAINQAKKLNWFQRAIKWIDNLLHDCQCSPGGPWGPCPC